MSGRLVPAEEFALELLDICVHPLQQSLNVERGAAMVAERDRAVREATLARFEELAEYLAMGVERNAASEHNNQGKPLAIVHGAKSVALYEAEGLLRAAITAARGENQPKE